MSDIKLTFINRSNDLNSSEIVIFQKNEASDYGEIAIAWKVIQHCGQGFSHPFVYPMQMYVSSTDSYGNLSPLKGASNGQQFQVSLNGSGDTLQYAGQASSQDEVEVLNALLQGAITASIYKDSRLLATKTGIAPGQKAVFEFKPSIWVGVVSQIEEGDVMNSAILSQINTELSLKGLKSADLVMTGGGPGASSTPFTFTLENKIYA